MDLWLDATQIWAKIKVYFLRHLRLGASRQHHRSRSGNSPSPPFQGGEGRGEEGRLEYLIRIARPKAKTNQPDGHQEQTGETAANGIRDYARRSQDKTEEDNAEKDKIPPA